jgi:hypothetical protein
MYIDFFFVVVVVVVGERVVLKQDLEDGCASAIS